MEPPSSSSWTSTTNFRRASKSPCRVNSYFGFEMHLTCLKIMTELVRSNMYVRNGWWIVAWKFTDGFWDIKNSCESNNVRTWRGRLAFSSLRLSTRTLKLFQSVAKFSLKRFPFKRSHGPKFRTFMSQNYCDISVFCRENLIVIAQNGTWFVR